MLQQNNHNIILPKYFDFVKKIGSIFSLPAHGRVGARATSSLAAHFARQNTKFGGGGKRGRAKIPSPQPPSFLPARAFRFCARSAQSFWIFFKKSSDFVQKVPPFYEFFIFGRDCLAASPLGRRAKRARARFCEDLPRSAWRKGNGLISDLEVRLGEAQNKTKCCNQSFFVSPLAKLGSDNFNILTALI